MTNQEQKQISEAESRLEKLKIASEPLRKLLCEEYHPHYTIILTGTSLELLESHSSLPQLFELVVD